MMTDNSDEERYEVVLQEQRGQQQQHRGVNNNRRDDLLALIKWLRTFPQFECINNCINTKGYNELFNNKNNNGNDTDEMTLLEDVNFVNAILLVTEEIILGRKNNNNNNSSSLQITASTSSLSMSSTDATISEDSVDKIWGKIFHTITKKHKHILTQQIAGKHFDGNGKEHLRFILLSNLLCISVNSSDNAKYVERIMKLDNSLQSKLRILLEAQESTSTPTPTRSTSTPTRTPNSSRYYRTTNSSNNKTTPKSSNKKSSRHNNNHTPSSLMKAASQSQQKQQQQQSPQPSSLIKAASQSPQPSKQQRDASPLQQSSPYKNSPYRKKGGGGRGNNTSSSKNKHNNNDGSKDFEPRGAVSSTSSPLRPQPSSTSGNSPYRRGGKDVTTSSSSRKEPSIDDNNYYDEMKQPSREASPDSICASPGGGIGGSSRKKNVSFTPQRPSSSSNIHNSTPASIRSSRSNTSFATPLRTKEEQEEENLFALIQWLHTFNQFDNDQTKDKDGSSSSSPHISTETTEFLSTIINKPNSSNQRNLLIDDDTFSVAVLQITKEIFDDDDGDDIEHNDIGTVATAATTFSDSSSIVTSSNNTNSGTWDKIKCLITSNVVHGDDIIDNICGTYDDDNKNARIVSKRIALLSTLLCYAVATNCSLRSTYISRITSLTADVQICLMNIIQEHGSRYNINNSSRKSMSSSKKKMNNSRLSPTPESIRRVGGGSKGHHYEITSSATPHTSSSLSRSAARSYKDAFGSPSRPNTSSSNYTPYSNKTGHTPQRKKHASIATPVGVYGGTTGSPIVMSMSLEKQLQSSSSSSQTAMIEKMVKENSRLLQELQESQRREKELGNQVHDCESKFRRDMMQIESKSMQREDELRIQYENEIISCQKEIDDLRNDKVQSDSVQDEIITLKEEIDILHHTKNKLDVAEEKIRNYKERLEQYHTIKDALQKEEDAHAASVEECIHLSNELSTYQPIKRQLEEYKQKALNAEVMLAECQDELSKLKQNSSKIQQDNYLLLQTTSSQQEEANTLRKQLKCVGSEDDDLMAIGDGFSELNPAVKEEVLRLRNENKQLREFADKRSDDSVQRLGEELDDKERLSKKFKDQYLSTKNCLEDTEMELADTQRREEILTGQVADWKELTSKAEDRNIEYTNQLKKVRGDLDDTRKALDASKQRESKLLDDIDMWTKKTSSAEDMIDEYTKELNTTVGNLDDTCKALDESKQREAKLLVDVDMWTKKTEQAEDRITHITDELNTTKSTLNDTCQSLKELQQREADLNDAVATWTDKNGKAEARIDELTTELKTKNTDLDDTRQALEDAQATIQNLHDDVEELEQKTDDAECIASQRKELLQTTRSKLEETEKALQESKDHAAQLFQQVVEWTESTNAANKLLGQYQNELSTIEATLNETKLQLSGSIKREESLNANVQDLTTKKNELEANLDELRLSTEQELNAANIKLKETEAHLRSEATKEREQVEKNMNLLLDDERQAYLKLMSKKTEELDHLEKKLKKEINDVKESSLVELESSQETAKERYDKMEQVYKLQLEENEKKAATEIDDLTTKGQEMIKEIKGKSNRKIKDLEDKTQELRDTLSQMQDDLAAYEKKSHARINSYKQKLSFATTRISQLTTDNDEMQDSIKALEREKFKKQEENDRFRRQLGGRYGADGKVQSQLEMLQKEFNAVLDENRELKANAKALNSSSYGTIDILADLNASEVISNSKSGEGGSSYSAGTVNRSTLAQYREEYEETIQSLKDEKRELVMRNSAAITDVQKAEQRAWESEKENAKLKEELTSVRLSLQRAERVAEINPLTGEGVPDASFSNDNDDKINSNVKYNDNDNNTSYKRTMSSYSDDTCENRQPISSERYVAANAGAKKTTNNAVSPALSSKQVLSPNYKLSTPSSQYKNETTPNRGLQQVLCGKNRQTMLLDVYGNSTSTNNNIGSSATKRSTSEKKTVPTLMEYTTVGGTATDVEGKQECQQS